MTEKKALRHTYQNFAWLPQHATQLSTLGYGHCLLGSDLREVKLDVLAESILPRTGLPGTSDESP